MEIIMTHFEYSYPGYFILYKKVTYRKIYFQSQVQNSVDSAVYTLSSTISFVRRSLS